MKSVSVLGYLVLVALTFSGAVSLVYALPFQLQLHTLWLRCQFKEERGGRDETSQLLRGHHCNEVRTFLLGGFSRHRDIGPKKRPGRSCETSKMLHVFGLLFPDIEDIYTLSRSASSCYYGKGRKISKYEKNARM